MEQTSERAIRVEKGSSWESFKRFIKARETRMVIGILMLTFAIIALLSYVSFLFTGTFDQDLLSMEHAERVANRESIKNLLGLPGAVLARFLIDGSFGFVSILLVFMLTIYALRLMHVFKDIHPVIEVMVAGNPDIIVHQVLRPHHRMDGVMDEQFRHVALHGIAKINQDGILICDIANR